MGGKNGDDKNILTHLSQTLHMDFCRASTDPLPGTRDCDVIRMCIFDTVDLEINKSAIACALLLLLELLLLPLLDNRSTSRQC